MNRVSACHEALSAAAKAIASLRTCESILHDCTECLSDEDLELAHSAMLEIEITTTLMLAAVDAAYRKPTIVIPDPWPQSCLKT